MRRKSLVCNGQMLLAGGACPNFDTGKHLNNTCENEVQVKDENSANAVKVKSAPPPLHQVREAIAARWPNK